MQLLLVARPDVARAGINPRSPAFQRVQAQIREEAAAVPLLVCDLLGNWYEVHGWAQQSKLRMLVVQ